MKKQGVIVLGLFYIVGMLGAGAIVTAIVNTSPADGGYYGGETKCVNGTTWQRSLPNEPYTVKEGPLSRVGGPQYVPCTWEQREAAGEQ